MTKILDCTLRDGGYYNNWEFDFELVDRYLEAIDNSSGFIKYIEIGFRCPFDKTGKGCFAYSRDRHLNKLRELKNAELGVMINASDYINNPEYIDKYFCTKKDSRISFIRIAAHYKEISNCKILAEKLNNLGYKVILNIMQISLIIKEDVINVVKEIKSWNLIDVLYFADSLGSMSQEDIYDKVEWIKVAGWKNDIGFHGHDNKGIALSNSIEARKCIGESRAWIDGTILGMGRGAGNTRTEHLITELTHDAYSIYSLVLNDFEKLEKEYKWGKNSNDLYYYIAANRDIHPSYVQSMLDLNYEPDTILNYMAILTGKKSYNKSLIREEVSFSVKGKSDACDEINNSDVLLLANGPKLEKYKEEVEEFIKKNKPFVISLNKNKYIDEKYINRISICDYRRIKIEINSYINSNIIIPVLLADQIDSSNNCLDYGVHIDRSNFVAEKTDCTIPYLMAAPYSFAFAVSGGASKIFLAGFDGYENSHEKQIEMEDFLKIYFNSEKHVPVISITPTTYSVDKIPVWIIDEYDKA